MNATLEKPWFDFHDELIGEDTLRSLALYGNSTLNLVITVPAEPCPESKLSAIAYVRHQYREKISQAEDEPISERRFAGELLNGVINGMVDFHGGEMIVDYFLFTTPNIRAIDFRYGPLKPTDNMEFYDQAGDQITSFMNASNLSEKQKQTYELMKKARNQSNSVVLNEELLNIIYSNPDKDTHWVEREIDALIKKNICPANIGDISLFL